MPKDEKQMKIAEGMKKGKSDYPTMDDVLSDWDSKKENKKYSKKIRKKIRIQNQKMLIILSSQFKRIKKKKQKQKQKVDQKKKKNLF